MLKIGDTVKVISKTLCGGEMKELIPIGTICEITSIEKENDGSYYYEVLPLNYIYDIGSYYLEKELEKGHMEWIKD